MYKVIVQEESPMNEDELTYMQTKYEVTSHSKKVFAETLRAIANEYDPPGTSRSLPTIYKGDQQ